MIEVKARGRKILVGKQAPIPVEVDEHGAPICPRCGTTATEDAPGFWVCSVIECDGYHQTVFAS